MEIVIGVAAKVAGYTVGPIVRPIARRCPFKNLWEYKSNLENLKTELKNLEAKRESVQGLTNVGVEPLPAVKAWQDKVTNIIREVSGLTSEDNPRQQTMKCCKGCTYSNWKECYQHRNNVARKLKDVAQLLQEAMKSTNLWEYKSNLENLKKEVEKLKARRESVQCLIKDGEEPLQHVKLWQENVNNTIAEVSGLINPQQQNMQCCNGLICSDLDICYQRRNNVARVLGGVALLLQEARDFRGVSTISEETVYKSNLEKLKKEVEKLEAKRDGVKCSIKVGEESLPDVKLWQDKVNTIINEVSGLTSKHNPQQQNNVARILEDVAQLLQEAMKSASLWEYKSNLQKLKKEVETLKFKRESVQRLIEVGEEPLPDVKVWQDRVKKIIDEVPGLTIEHNPEHQNKVAQILKEIAQLLQEAAQFREVSRPSIPEQICLQPSTQQEFSESRISILKDIIAALTKADVNMVGIYGMGGVGKTTLAKKVGSQAMQDKFFEKIVFVEVSQSPDIRTIQGVIADYLGLKFQEETVPGRAIKLCDVLKKEKKILIILDNLWKGIKLEEVGIPFGNECKGLKLLLTARSRDVLTKGTDSQHNFHVEALSKADAWILFKSIAGTCIDHPHLKSVAQQVAKKCGGMPVAIVTIAKALKDTQSEDEWKEALRRLNNPSPENFEGITKEVYNSIKLSYDCLDGKLKELFLLCSLMGCTYDASVEDLFRYGLGLGFFDEFDSVEDALCNVYASVNQLKAASLLLDAHAPYRFFHPTLVCERFAIHDVICAVARSIASEDRHVLFVPQSLTNENKLKNCTSISLHNIGELLKDLKLECPQLKFLYVKPMFACPKTPSRISDKFFAWMPKLQVLHLIEMDLCFTPLSDLVNLQTLCLEYCVLKDIADIRDLKNLEILSFRNCSGFKLPEKLPQLTKLRLLELNCFELKRIPIEFVLSFKKLEALYMGYTNVKWEVEKSNNGSRNASRDVLEHLSNLTSLEICVPDATITRGLLSPMLERFYITIGGFLSRDMWRGKTSRFLRVNLITNEDGIISRLKPVRQLVLDEVPGIANNFCGLDRRGFPELEDLQVQNNSHILHIVDAVSDDDAFPALKSLIILNLINLRTICNGSLGMKLFHQLRTIKVEKCPELTNLFSFASDRVFQELEEIEVEHCEKMKETFAISEQVHELKFSKLRLLRLTSLPRLESLCCNVKTTTPVLQFTSDIKHEEIILEEEWDVSKPLFNDKVVVTNLETLEINNINIKWIWDNQFPTMANIPNLTCLIISNLANLRRLGSGDYIKLPSLKEMTIESCPKFKKFLFDDKVGVPSLEKINIFKMHKLKMIWYNQLAEDSFPKLKSLQVQECQMLLTLFPSNMCGSFLNLETLNVSECGSLEEIVDLRGINSEESHPTASTQSRELCTYSPLVLSFSNLQNLNVSKCQGLKTLFSTSIVAKEEVPEQGPATASFIFAKLTSLELYGLLELRTFYPGRYTTEWPILKALKMNQLGIDGPDWMRQQQALLQLQRKQQQPQKQVGFEFQVGKIWPNLLWMMSSWVQSLTKLIVHGCGNLEELFPNSMIITEELREKKTGNTIMFPKLNYLEMEQLANLKGLCSGCHIEFPALSEFKISNCPELTAFIFDDKVKVPSLKKLKISSMDNLKKIWDNHLAENSIPKLKSLQVQGYDKVLTWLQWNMCESFLSLETLDVSDCGSLEEIFDLHTINPKERHFATSTQSKELYTMVLSFANLQNLKVSKCRSLKSLFSVLNVAKDRGEEKETHATTKFVFPKLTSLELYKLPELRTFYPARYTVEWPILRSLWQCDCGMFDRNKNILMQQQSFLHRVGFEFQVEKIWPNLLWTMFSWVQSLTKLIVHGCGNLEELFPNSMISTEELREKKTGNTIMFPKLNYLEMEQLTNLKGLCSGCHIEFPALSEFKISNCPELTAFIFDDKVKVPSLKKLKISSMENLKMIWDNHLTENSIPKLNSLQVQGCDKVLTWLQWNKCESFLSLETLDVSDCGSLEEIFDLHAINSEERHFATSTQPKELCTTVLSFANLQHLKVSRCESLKSLFSVSNVAKDRGEAEEMYPTARFVFPKLTSLELYKLPELRTFYPARYAVEWPVLRRLRQSDMDKDILMLSSWSPHWIEFPSLRNTSGPAIYVERIWLSWLLPMMSSSFQNLMKLVVHGCGNLKELFPSFNLIEEALREKETRNTILFPKLECLKMEYLANLTRLCSGYYIEFPSLKKFNISNCPKLKAFIFDHKVKVSSLTNLKISSMENLKMIWDNQLAKNSFPKLKSLQVQGCYKVVDLLQWNMRESFSSLEALDVSDCGSLEEIFEIHAINSEERHLTTSTQSKELYTTILSFANLQNLKVSKCESLKSLFLVSNATKDEGEGEEMHPTARFVFPKLTSLELYKLPELKTFYPTRCTVEWPVLRRLWQSDCGISNTDKNILMLLQPFPQWKESSRLWTTDGLEIYVERIWLNWLLPVMSSSFQNLTKLVVYGYGNLKELFPSFNLVEEALREKEMGNTILFPKLECIKMKYLANLTRLCSGYYIEFPSLKKFKISNCPEFKAFIFDHKVKVPSLTKLKISSMDNLKMIWDNQLVENSIPKLRSSQVQGCHKVLTWLQWDMCESFSSLETLDVSDCGSLEEIFDLHAINYEERHFVTSTQFKELYTTVLSFANLQNLKVSDCGSLKSLFSVSNVAKDGEVEEMHATARFVFPKLTSLELYKLPELRTFYPARYTVEWPVLRSLRQCDCGTSDTNKNILMQRQSVLHRNEFSNLQKMDGLEILVERIWLSWLLPMMSSTFQNLTKLVVYGCGNLTELFPSSNLVKEELQEKKMENAILFPKLEYLKMEHLANLTRLCSEYCIEFPALKACNISNCPKLKAFIFDHKVKVHSLTELKISSMDNLKMIWDSQLAKNSIPKLKSLKVQGCQKLLTFFLSNVYGRFLSLETLDVSDCGSLEEIFDLHEINSKKKYSTTSTQSEDLCTTVLSFANLRYLKVSECGSLKSLFSISNVAKESVAAKEAYATAKFVFPKLTSLKLYKLPELRSFYPSRYNVEWPNLKRSQLWDCGIPDTDYEDQMQHLLFLVKKAVLCLGELMLSGRELMMMWQGQDPELLFRNFKILEVLDESKVLDKFFQIGRNCEGQPVLQYIGDMKYMWKQNFKLDLILPNFEKIVVGRCDSFIILMPPSASFRNLTSLEVNDCNSLEHIGTFSMAKNLVKLVSLRIFCCKKIVEVLRNHEDVTGDKILFSNLKRLSLVCLLSLTSFCSWNFTLEFPSLEELEVYQCPNMKIFSRGQLTTPKLHEVKSYGQSIKLCPDVDVSTAIQQLHEQKQFAKSFTRSRIDISTGEFSTDESE